MKKTIHLIYPTNINLDINPWSIGNNVIAVLKKFFIIKTYLWTSLRKINPNKGDILMPMIGTIGNPLIVDMEVDFAIKNVALIKKSIDQIVNVEIIYFLLAGHYLQWYSSRNNKGGTQKFLSLGDIRKMPIIIPNDKLQNQFADSVQAIEAQKTQAQASLAQAEDLFNCLLQRAFKGKLTS